MNKPDVIERKITLSCTIERAWAALTDADQLAQWFGDSASVDLRPGGAMHLGWSEYEASATCRVEAVEPPSIFSFWWSTEAEDGTAFETLVTFTLIAKGDTTIVTVVESGLASLPDDLHAAMLEDNSEGWESELRDLGDLVGVPR